MEILLIILVAYLLGSIPSAVIISKLFFGFDIRQKGSGNMGSTNTFRVLGWKAGVAVQLLDILKGVAAVIIAEKIFNGVLPFPNATGFEDITVVKTIAGVAAVIGHIWTAFAGFRGGKGINTALGMLIGIAPVELAVAVGIFLLVVFASGYVYGKKADLRVLAAADLTERDAFAPLEDRVEQLALSADGKWLAGKSWLTLRTWHVGGPKLPARAAATSGLAVFPTPSVSVKPGETRVTRRSGPDSWRSPSLRIFTAVFVAA